MTRPKVPTADSGWTRLPPPPVQPVCDLCPRFACYRHTAGGLRCAYCPRPEDMLTGLSVTDEQIRKLFALHCECRPINIDRMSHGHDCDTAITDHCRVALGGKVTNHLRSHRSAEQAINDRYHARATCANIINGDRETL